MGNLHNSLSSQTQLLLYVRTSIGLWWLKAAAPLSKARDRRHLLTNLAKTAISCSHTIFNARHCPSWSIYVIYVCVFRVCLFFVVVSPVIVSVIFIYFFPRPCQGSNCTCDFTITLLHTPVSEVLYPFFFPLYSYCYSF